MNNAITHVNPLGLELHHINGCQGCPQDRFGNLDCYNRAIDAHMRRKTS